MNGVDMGFDRYYEAYLEAERLRKDGRGTEARVYYEEAIRQIEAAPDWGRDGLVPPAPYREFAKMLYHMERDAEALAVLDRYIEINSARDNGFEEFRERVASGDMRRFRNKYS